MTNLYFGEHPWVVGEPELAAELGSLRMRSRARSIKHFKKRMMCVVSVEEAGWGVELLKSYVSSTTAYRWFMCIVLETLEVFHAPIVTCYIEYGW